MEKQQTAVEWLAEKYNYVTWMRNRDEISAEMADELRKKYLEQANKMFEEQIIEAFTTSRDPYGISVGNSYSIEKAEQYYNSAFKSE